MTIPFAQVAGFFVFQLDDSKLYEKCIRFWVIGKVWSMVKLTAFLIWVVGFLQVLGHFGYLLSLNNGYSNASGDCLSPNPSLSVHQTRSNVPSFCSQMGLQSFFHKSKNTLRVHRERSPKQMGVSKNTGTPKWMVYNGKPY